MKTSLQGDIQFNHEEVPNQHRSASKSPRDGSEVTPCPDLQSTARERHPLLFKKQTLFLSLFGLRLHLLL